MSQNDVVRARVSAKLKRDAADVLKKIGLTPSDAFRLLLTRVAAEKRLPFEPLIPNAKTIAAMQEARRGGGKSVKTVKELWAALDAEDDQVDDGVQKRSKARAARPLRGRTRKAA
jgi:DNA-damage-inducible protein J